MPLRSILAAILALTCASARADIYQSVSDDGSVTLSNLPGSARDVLVSEERTGDAAPARAPERSSPVGASAARPSVADGAPVPAPEGASNTRPAVPRIAEPDRPIGPASAASVPIARPPSVAVAMHFAPGAPGAPAWSDTPVPAPDGRPSAADWPAAARPGGSTGAAMPISPPELPAWAAQAPSAAMSSRPAEDDAAAEYRVATDDIVSAVALKHALDPALLHAVVTVESAYNSRAVSPRGATGLMQVLPETARRYGVRDLFDPVQNLTAGAAYLRDLLRLFKQDVALALAAYNAGENAVIRHGNAIPPYPETQNYVPRVIATWRAYSKYFARKRT